MNPELKQKIVAQRWRRMEKEGMRRPKDKAEEKRRLREAHDR